MTLSTNTKRYFIVNLLIILPFLIISIYNQPFNDDFSRAHLWTIEKYYDRLSIWYLISNGRYFNAIISLIPIFYIPVVYKATFLLFGGFFTYCLYLVIKNLVPKSSTQIHWLTATTILSYTLLITPKLSAAFYWLAGVTAYLFSISCFLLVLSCLLRDYNQPKKDYKNTFLLVVGIFMGVGSNEVTMLMIVLIVSLYNLFTLKFHRSKLVKSSLSHIWAWICSGLVLFAPGTLNRQDKHPLAKQLLPSLEHAFFDGIEFLTEQLTSNYLLIILSLIFLMAVSFNSNKDIGRINISPLYTFGLVIVSIFLIIFVFNYSQGWFKIHYKHRTTNLLYIYFSIFWFVFIYTLGVYLSKIKHKPLLLFKRIDLLLIVFIFFTINNKNYENVLGDLSSGDAKKFNEFRIKRDQYIINNSHYSTVYVPKDMYKPKTTYFTDISPNTSDWVNHGYSLYLKAKSKISCNDQLFFDSYNNSKKDTSSFPWRLNYKNGDELMRLFRNNHHIITVQKPNSTLETNRTEIRFHPSNMKDLPKDIAPLKFESKSITWLTNNDELEILLPNYQINKIETLHYFDSTLVTQSTKPLSL